MSEYAEKRLKTGSRQKPLFNLLFMNKRVLSFIEPFLSYIDSGKLFRRPFGHLYLALAVFNAVLPFYLLYVAIDNRVFSAGAKYVFAFLLIWLVIVAACWVGVQIWWNRKDRVQVTSQEGSEFPATPVIAHFIQTLGEWLGALTAIIGFGFSLFATIFLGEEARMLGAMLNLPLNSGLWGLVLYPVYGFLIIVVARFIAEQCRALAVIANNTRAASR
jgi:hypothetical protein